MSPTQPSDPTSRPAHPRPEHPDQQTLWQLWQLIFGDDRPEEWAQDVWDMSPTLGETAARVVEALRDLGDRVPAADLAALVEHYQSTQTPPDPED